MNGQHQPGFSAIIRPYILIAITGILAFAPVSFMLQSLKNDIVVIEYPINYFLSQCIHNGELPYWFNTWGMGFPLYSSLTWGVFSTPQMLFNSLFDYNIYILHIEFIFFLLLAGWGMFYLLKKYLVRDENISLLLSVCYMLSGFTVGSTQWLLYITAASFIPLVISSLLKLLQTPTVKNAMQLAVWYTMMFTSVYAAFNIITTYSLILFIIIYFLRPGKKGKPKIIAFGYAALAGIFILLLCGPCIYYTAELLNYLERGSSIAANTSFFSSNYLHPAALGNLLLPFSSVRMSFANTEGTMLHTYAGLFILLLIPAAIVQTIKEKNREAFVLLVAGILFLFLSFGSITPVRNAFNILPGFSYFRNPAIFRLFFLLALIIYLAFTFRNRSFEELFSAGNNPIGKITRYTLLSLLATCLIFLILNAKSISQLPLSSIPGFIKNINLSQTLFISSLIQLVILSVVMLTVRTKQYKFTGWVLAADLVVNTIICTPFFSVSSYSLPEVNNILRGKKGFPVQETKISEAATTYTDEKTNKWDNINVYSKEVSSNDSYRGPLTLKDFYRYTSDSIRRSSFFDKQLIFAGNDGGETLKLVLQKPAHISASVNFSEPATITFLQNYYPGWHAYYNDKEIELVKKDSPGMTIHIPKGKGIIDFRYERKFAWTSALLLHFIITGFFLWRLWYFTRRRFFTTSSLS